MIDPTKITDFNRNDYSLQEVSIFWILAAGKNAKFVSKALDLIIKYGHEIYGNNLMPFDIFKKMGNDLPFILKKYGVGCYNNKSKSILELVNSSIDLRNCTVSDLESIRGIGPKTARCFIIHTRKDAKYAGLDTHVLKFLRDKGYNVPSSTPSSSKKYLEIEKIFLDIVDQYGTTIAELDLKIWNDYSSRKVKSETKRSFEKTVGNEL